MPSGSPPSDRRAGSGDIPGPYVLRSLLADIPLAEDDSANGSVHITCVEFWNDNLYIGTSTAELLHYVLIPSDPHDLSQDPSFILASRLKPSFTGAPPASDAGIQQILVLPDAAKASILCNGTATFYSLPELTPAYGSSFKIANCSWIGGVDISQDEQDVQPDSSLVMACQKNCIRLVRIGQKPQKVKEIVLPGVVAAVRRGDIACAANPRSYSLIDVAEQQSIPLFDVTSDPPPLTPIESDQQHNLPAAVKRDPSPDVDQSDSSLDSEQAAKADTQKALPELPQEEPVAADAALKQATETVDKPAEKADEKPTDKPAAPADTSSKARGEAISLRPHIVSPSEDRFLLTMGTSHREPGIGMYVNLDGDVVPPSLEFSRYPLALAIDRQNSAAQDSDPGLDDAANYIFAAIDSGSEGSSELRIEIQSCDVDAGADPQGKEWLDMPPSSSKSSHFGLRSAQSPQGLVLSAVVQMLHNSNIQLRPTQEDTKSDKNAVKAREQSGIEFVVRISRTHCNVLVWNGSSIWSAAPTPVVLQLDAQLEAALLEAYGDSTGNVDRSRVEKVFGDLRDRDPRTELEFISFGYIRQKASLLLFIGLASQTCNDISTSDRDRRLTEDALIAGEIDPRIILALVPRIRKEIVTDASGVWIPAGLIGVVQSAYTERDKLGDSDEAVQPFLGGMLTLVKNYLQFWRQKKGFGSIEDESNIFQSVDAALIHILLILDQNTPPGPARDGSVRQELNSIVDRGVDCFERAVELLEQYQRLYVLSRLYQSRKESSRVLSTWQRILDGETDRGGEFADGEGGVRRYLSQIKDRAIVEQYGTWLAKRNPELGVHVFTQSNSRVKFTPDEAIALLKQRAPDAVQHFLEHLVFAKNLPRHANDLIAYYLDSVVAELDKSKESRAKLRESYKAYRALRPPKPTYSQFVSETSIDANWWRNRLRLLQLLGGSHGAASQYDVAEILARIEPYSEELVPEMIILGGRQGRHHEAIRLLTHGLGDYDTAIRYCVRGGSGTYSIQGASGGSEIASHAEQRQLFDKLLAEFFKIDDPQDRIAQVSELLERYAAWFDVSHVLDIVPDGWSVELLSGFLENAFRHLVTEKHQTAVAKALLGAQNLGVNAGLVEKLDSMKPVHDVAVEPSVST